MLVCTCHLWCSVHKNATTNQVEVTSAVYKVTAISPGKHTVTCHMNQTACCLHKALRFYCKFATFEEASLLNAMQDMH